MSRRNQKSRPFCRYRHRGTVLVYCAISFTALCGFVSLGVDLGRAQLAKTELQRAADAAARYAVQGASDGTYLTKAQTAASANTVDSTALALLAGDVTLGTWAANAFTPGGSSPNAVKVVAVRSAARGTAVPLMFAQVLGFNSCNVSATSIAYKTPSVVGTYAVAGTNSVSFINGAKTDSYDSSSGAYSAGSAGSAGNIGSNGSVSLSGGTTKVKGNVDYGTTLSNPSSTITGALTQLSTTMVFPAASPPPAGSYTYYGTQNVSSGSMPMPGGIYYFDALSMSGGAFTMQGPATIYINGALTMSGGQIVPYLNRPENLRIINLSSANMAFSNASALVADVYAPNSVTTFTGASAQLYGRIIAKTATIDGGAIHYDTSLSSVGNVSGAGAITTVK